MTAFITPETRIDELMALSDGSAVIELTCPAGEYSASRLAHAVEDADTPLLGLWVRPASDGSSCVTLLIGASDSTAVRRSLERYGYQIISTRDNGHSADQQIALERLGQLRVLLNV